MSGPYDELDKGLKRLGDALRSEWLRISQKVLRVFWREPDFIIGDPASPYLRRWWVIPRNRLFNIYLHNILRSDDDRALHDHPWHNCSIVLKGGYTEVTLSKRDRRMWWKTLGKKFHGESQWWDADGNTKEYARFLYSTSDLPSVRVKRRAGSIIFRRAQTPHRLVVETGKPCWTLFITGPVIRSWGFHLTMWTYYRNVVKPENPGEWKND